MNAIVEFIMKHGYSVLFGALFAHQIGLPVPGPLFLLAAGALAAAGKLVLASALLLAVVACVLADWIWYEAGRLRGKRVLHFLYRFATDPAAADRRARKKFARYGPPILVFDKFVPGLDAVAPPLAGTSGTSRLRFLTLETTGAALYSGLYAGLGYVFCHDLDRVAAYAGRAGTLLGGLAFGVLAIYFIRKLIHRFTRESQVTRITPADPTELGDSIGKLCRITEGSDHDQ
jgi:membrane protein DedA with SNARE-associated domain